jgi:hypothetical protein
LKAELSKKRDEFKLKRSLHQSTIQNNSNINETEQYELNRTNSKWGKVVAKKVKQKDDNEPKTSKASEEQSRIEEKERELFDNSRRMLEKKVNFYNKLTSGQLIQGDNNLLFSLYSTHYYSKSK